jgi:hypothetical protein
MGNAVTYYDDGGNGYNTNWVNPNTNWVAACGRNILTAGSAGTIINGVVTSTTKGGEGNCELAINLVSTETSDWQLSKVYVWNTHLPDAVFAEASEKLNNYLAGSGSDVSSASSTCIACVAGKYKTLTGNATCTDCAAGTYSTAVGASASSTCSACPTSCTCNAGSTGFRLVPYLQFRLVPMVFRGITGYFQVSEFRFFDMQTSQITPTNATNPGGSNPSLQDPGKMIDEDNNTKFVDLNRQPAEFQFSSQVVLGSYEWVTGEDEPDWDMLSWRLEGRQTAEDAWTTLHNVSNYLTTQDRKQIVGRFDICP